MNKSILDNICGTETKKIKLYELFFFAAVFFLLCYTEIRTVIGEKIGHFSSLYFIFTYGLLVLSFMFGQSNKKIKKSKFYMLAAIMFFISLYFIFTILFHPEYDKVLFGPFNIIENIIFPMSAFWTIFFFACESDDRVMLKTLFIVGITRWALLIVQAKEVMRTGFWKLTESTLSGGTVEVVHTYNINWAYKLFACNCIFLVLYYRSKNKLLLIPIFVGQIMVLLFGSRGAFFMFFVFWIVCYLFCNEDRKVGKRAALITLAGVLVIIWFASGSATNVLVDIIERTGITSRTIVMFLNGEIASDSGRNLIYSKAIEMLKDVHVFGYGIYGDRYNIITIGQIATNGYGYVHNVFLEILITYGFFGICLLYIGINKIVKVFTKYKDFDLKCLYLICFGCSMNLFFSSSYWYQYFFWAMIGLMIRDTSLRVGRRNKIKSFS